MFSLLFFHIILLLKEDQIDHMITYVYIVQL